MNIMVECVLGRICLTHECGNANNAAFKYNPYVIE